MPSTAAKATRRSPKHDSSSCIQRIAQVALALIAGTSREVSQVCEVERGELTRLHRPEKVVATFGVAYVAVDEERVDFRMDLRGVSPI